MNYTVFGREVNLASRLEGVAERNQIIIGESTYQELRRDDPGLAETCVALPPVLVKGSQDPVNISEVAWATAGSGNPPKSSPMTIPPPST